ncbi:hypothetical protein PFISCL1PPCAC_27425, partial [Pristionchus fissidentatus]
RPSRPATELGRKKEDQRRERSTSAKPITQPSTSKEPVRSESKSIERKTKEMSREKSKERNSPYAKRFARMASKRSTQTDCAVRKPVQAAVKKLQEMGDTTSLHDQLKMARETVETLK